MKAERNLTLAETCEVIMRVCTEYKAVRLTRKQFTHLVGRVHLHDSFVNELAYELFLRGDTVLLIEEEEDDRYHTFVVTSVERAIGSCLKGTYCKGNRTMRGDSVDRMIRVYSDVLIEENDEEGV